MALIAVGCDGEGDGGSHTDESHPSGSFEPPQGAIELDANEPDIAFRFRPHLRFDTEEPWRPVSLEALANETFPDGERDEICTKPGGDGDCNPFRLGRLAKEFLWLDLTGRAADGGDAKAPEAALRTCRARPPLRDCDTGPSAAIYYHLFPLRPAEEKGVRYRYLDFWSFFRFNDAGATNAFDHEGDWEGMALVLGAEMNRPVQWVEVAAHETVASYLPGVVEWSPNHHPRIYVARGTHASYIRACKQACRQAEKKIGVALPERSSDGVLEWGQNDDKSCEAKPSCLRPLEEGGKPLSWVVWPGRWGSTLHPRVNRLLVRAAIAGLIRIQFTSDGGMAELISPVAKIYGEANGPDRSPCSPLYQVRYLSPWLAAVTGRRPEAGDCGTPSGQAADCKRWAGPYVVALVCDEETLRGAIRNGQLTEAGEIRLEITRQGNPGRDSIATAPGIAQLVGPLLEPGDKVTVTGRAAPGTFLLVRARSGRLTEKAAVFDEVRLNALGLDLKPRGKATVSIKTGTFGPQFDFDPAAPVEAPPYPRLGKPKPPIRALSARRERNGVRLTFWTASRRILIAFAARRRGPILAYANRTAAPGRRQALTVRAPRSARRIAVAAVDRKGVVGEFVERPILSTLP